MTPGDGGGEPIRWPAIPYYVHTPPERPDTMSDPADHYHVEIHRVGNGEWTWRLVANAAHVIHARSALTFTAHSLASRHAENLFPDFGLVDVE